MPTVRKRTVNKSVLIKLGIFVFSQGYCSEIMSNVIDRKKELDQGAYFSLTSMYFNIKARATNMTYLYMDKQSFADTISTRTFVGKHMTNLSILILNVMGYGHILSQDLRPFEKPKCLSFLFYHLSFLFIYFDSYTSACIA